jgi:transcriptional regulator with XRE-family HTH domain
VDIRSAQQRAWENKVAKGSNTTDIDLQDHIEAKMAKNEAVDQFDETAGSLLRRARIGAGLSQAELAVRAGVAQSVISAYEAGRRQPALPTLARLVDATGYDLVVDVQWQPPQLSRLCGPVGLLVRHRRRELVAAAAAHDVRNLRVFGSVARGEDRADSDVDLPAGMGLLGLGRVQAELEAILGTG